VHNKTPSLYNRRSRDRRKDTLSEDILSQQHKAEIQTMNSITPKTLFLTVFAVIMVKAAVISTFLIQGMKEGISNQP
jgi:hypothetical protein